MAGVKGGIKFFWDLLDLYKIFYNAINQII